MYFFVLFCFVLATEVQTNMLAAVLSLSCPALAQNAPMGPLDPPFDATRVLFSTAFNDHMVLQRAPQHAVVFGTATPGATVTVTLTGPNAYTYTSPAAAVRAGTGDPALDGTWKVVLPAQPAGFGYALAAACAGCSNATSAPATLADVGFGDVYLCSGQSNMECPILTTTAASETFNVTATGAYDHVRMFQMGWRYLGPRNTSSWILPDVCDSTRYSNCSHTTEQSSHDGGYAFRSWQPPHPRKSDWPDRFSSTCWYFGKALSDQMAANGGDSDPVPIGLVASTIGGTTIQVSRKGEGEEGRRAGVGWGGRQANAQVLTHTRMSSQAHARPHTRARRYTDMDARACTQQSHTSAHTCTPCFFQEWMPPTATGNDTCTENNCGWVEQGKQPSPTTCDNATLSNVWSCPSGVCSTLFHSMIAPFVNMTIAGTIWYQVRRSPMRVAAQTPFAPATSPVALVARSLAARGWTHRGGLIIARVKAASHPACLLPVLPARLPARPLLSSRTWHRGSKTFCTGGAVRRLATSASRQRSSSRGASISRPSHRRRRPTCPSAS